MSDKYPVLLQDFTRGAFEDYLREESNPVALMPLGSVEQHGPHLPLGMDIYAALEMAKEVARRTDSVVVHPCWPGFSPHHMGFAGTISFKAETLKRIILDTVESLAHHGIGKILILNGHGGNAEVVGYAARLANRRYEAKVLTSNAWSSGTSLGEMVEYVDKHAGAKETEVAQVLFGELVEMDRVEDYEPTAEFPPPVEELRDPDATDLELRAQLVMAYIDDTHEFSPSGIYSFEGAGPNEARPENAEEYLEESVQRFVRLIDYWKTID